MKGHEKNSRAAIIVLFKHGLIFLGLAFVGWLMIYYSFHRTVKLEQAKLLEELAKVGASCFLSVLSVYLGQAGEKLKIQKRAQAVREMAQTLLRVRRAELSRFLSARPNLPTSPEDHDFFEIARSHQHSLSEIAKTLNQVMDLITKDAEVGHACQSLVTEVAETLNALNMFVTSNSKASFHCLVKKLEELDWG
jgi:hypothetical protein